MRLSIRSRTSIPSDPFTLAALTLSLDRLCDGSLDSLQEIPTLRFGNDRTDARLIGARFEALQVQYRKEDYWHRWVRAGHQSSGFDAIHVRHRQIQQNQIRLQFVKFLNTRPSIVGLTADGPMTGAQNNSKDTSSDIGIVNNSNSQG